ncbi:MAG: alpha/beta fold hydrolase [Deltaproteobacteria bacterium]|nr:alpha/beta fold hydrolase [Deltaproteobacteria bacterium]MBI3386531.1 alpha/beta fold hydrolase [Deltaproteobacteria bacterium]
MSADTAKSRILALGAERPTIEVLEAGSGAPLLFLHGAGGVAAWAGVLPLLAREFHVYAPLLPGFGQSTGLDYLDDQFDLFLHGFDVMDALGLNQPYVVGESMGGWMAAEMAALRPDKIGRLALAAPIGLWRDEAPVADMFGMMNHEMVPLLFHDVTCPAAQAMLGLNALISDKDDRTAAQVETLIALARGARTAAKFLFPVPENGLERRLWRIQAETLIVWGANDRFIAPSYADIFKQKIRNAQVLQIPNAGHLLALEASAALGKALCDWGKRER